MSARCPLCGRTDEPADLERRIPVARVAEFLAVTPRRVQQMIQAGELDAVNVGAEGASRTRWAVSLRSVRSFVDARAEKQRTERNRDRESLALHTTEP